MIKSMTGYGKSNLTENNREYQIEIKSINHISRRRNKKNNNLKNKKRKNRNLHNIPKQQ